MHKKYTWHKIASSIEELDFGVNKLAGVEVVGKHICLARFDGQLKACAAKCPHASGVLSEGFLDGMGNITCPVHRYKFNLDNGRNVSGEGYHLKTYPVEVREDGVYIGFQEGGLMSWLR